MLDVYRTAIFILVDRWIATRRRSHQGFAPIPISRCHHVRARLALCICHPTHFLGPCADVELLHDKLDTVLREYSHITVDEGLLVLHRDIQLFADERTHLS